MMPLGRFARGGWICVRPYDEWLFATTGTAETPEEELLDRARAAIGNPDLEITVENRAAWQINHLYATGYRKGRIFVGGDAAHRHLLPVDSAPTRRSRTPISWRGSSQWSARERRGRDSSTRTATSASRSASSSRSGR